MLRGWKSASFSGFPAPSGATADDLIGVRGNLPAKKNIPMLSNQRLRPIPLMESSSLIKIPPLQIPFSCDFFYIVYFDLSKWDKSLGFGFPVRRKYECPGRASTLSRAN